MTKNLSVTIVDYVVDMASDDSISGQPITTYEEFANILEEVGIHATERLYEIYLNTYDELVEW